MTKQELKALRSGVLEVMGEKELENEITQDNHKWSLEEFINYLNEMIEFEK